MSRIFAGVLLAPMMVCGCTTSNDTRVVDGHTQCGRYAADRSQDAADNGFSPALQMQIAAQVYADCLKSSQTMAVVQRSGN